ncbi:MULTISPECIES: type II toxin-antitoxin system HipA family toxin [unclassified Halomonas]|uniref:type II toxin-antitoxin system HipA family toxin n=1 Tax=unclassified Halomonas TaxID=2609666 RepID=UPI0006DAE269|nr:MULTISPECIES: HipA domain-containing protein [unclassified Halomonas]KPQ21981.1 MAG: serine/threonine-protein kinase HipA [Halomonas sp. HL-93]SBR52647.1 serine/threonine-protein kinase HipA [Halomonas sp. HL-93]SNY97892.1 serine/threonine-protein kinase HipA [Halomonas sp. hl-4]
MLTIQAFHHGQWHDAAELVIESPEQGRRGPARLGYITDYALEWLDRDDEHACSLRLPIELMNTHQSPRWFAFLDDIMPSGASRRYWVTQLGISALSEAEQDYILLAKGTIAPVGNLRIKQALPERPVGNTLEQQRFALADVVDRDSDFLAYAQQMGAAGGGATGAGGEAPKLLLRCSPDDQVWIDTYQDDAANTDQHYLVKFPRGQRTELDNNILRAEYHFYHELASLGIATIETQGMRLIEGERYPSLWLPRFDVDFQGGERTLYGLESVYSIMESEPGSLLNHFAVIEALVGRLSQQFRVRESGGQFDTASFVSEWVKRDLLNVAFANSDNHGRNSALLKTPQGIWLAPVYDFAPMKADPEGVVRTTTWGAPFEEGREFNWAAIAERLNGYVPPEQLMAELKALGSQLVGLKERLAVRGVPEVLLVSNALGFDYLDDKLQRWGLI